MDKKCTKCGETKALKEFYQTKTTKDGFTCNCISCFQKYREENREKQTLYMRNLRDENREEINASKRKSWRNMDPIKKCLQQARGRAKRRGIEFNITEEDIISTNTCPLLDCPLFPGTKGSYEQTPSLDRIDPNKGYIKGNVWLMSKRANTMKSNASKEELIVFAMNILKFFKDDDIVRTILKDIELENKESQG